MTEKIHGTVSPGSSLTGTLNFYQVRTLLDIRPTGVVGDASQKRLDKLVQAISMRAQPVILGDIKVSVEAKADIEDLPAADAEVGPNVNVYVMNFSIEHNQAWEVSGVNLSLAETLNGVEGFVFTMPTDGNNVAVVKL